MRRYLAMTLIPMAVCAQAQTAATTQPAAAPSSATQPTATQPAAGAANSGYGPGGRRGGYNRPSPMLVINADAIIAAQQAADRAENAPPPPPTPSRPAKSKRGLHLSTAQPLSTSTGNP